MVWRRTTGAVARFAAAVAAFGAVLAVPHGTARAADVPAYTPAEDARAVRGAASSSDGPVLEPGLYTDRIGPGETLYYSVALDASSTAYLGATAAPEPGADVASFGDELTLRLQTTGGDACDTGDTGGFGSRGSGYPVGAYAVRRVGGGVEDCQEAGPYLFSVTRESADDGDPADWPIEIGYFSEPGLKGAVPGPPAVSETAEEPPTPPSGEAAPARGGTSFNDAGSVGTGVWKDRLLPGESRFYRVPVDWGQRLFVRLEVPNADDAGEDAPRYLSDGFALQMYNPARGRAFKADFPSYDGDQASAELLGRTVDYGRRFADEGRGFSMAGWWYVQVTLHDDMAAYFPGGAPVTLRTVVEGTAEEPPAYDGNAVAAGFGVTDGDREAAEQGLTAAEVAERATWRRLGLAGVGTGTVLVAGLAAWWLLARLRAPRTTAPEPAAPGGYGFPHPGGGAPGPGPQGRPPVFGPPPGGWPPPGDPRRG
ncbi:hypothetical protein WDH52_05300 [Streptomyces sp. TRM70308]|uniref:hypothetical protein n=1 Tax=Streptomyces sp. TRM70308 TaxID=3131932 RepID=UPI003D08D834